MNKFRGLSILFFLIFIFTINRSANALTTDLVVTACDLEDVSDGTCLTAISADGGSSFAFGKGKHLDASFQTLTASSVTSATLYYDSWATLSGSWAIYAKDARDGSTICSVDPAPQDGSEANNSTSCTLTTTQLSNGIWLQADNNDDKGSQDVNLDYVRMYVDYTAPTISISISTSGTVNLGGMELDTTQDTTAGGVNDVETVTVDSGPADLNIKSTTFADGGNIWTLGVSNGPTQAKWEFSKDGSAWSTFVASDTEYTLDTNVATSGTTDVYLRLTTPTSTATYADYSSTVTIVASAP